MIGANSTIVIGLKFWVCGAETKKPNSSRVVLLSAKRVSEDAACSNKVQNVTLKITRMMAATIIWNSCLVPTRHDQIGMPITAARKVTNSTLPRNGVAMRYPKTPLPGAASGVFITLRKISQNKGTDAIE